MTDEKFYNLFINGDCGSDLKKDAKPCREECREIETKYSLENLAISKDLAKFYRGVSFEDDNPFGDIGDDSQDDTSSGSDDPFGDVGSDSGDDPFNFDDMEDNSDDFFSDENNDNGEAKQKALTLDRAKAIKEDFDISRQIRDNFPDKFLAMRDIINNNILIVERTNPTSNDYNEVLIRLIEEYNKLNDLISTYIKVMPKKTYEDIFGTYVSFWTTMMKLKDVYLGITDTEEEDRDNMKRLSII